MPAPPPPGQRGRRLLLWRLGPEHEGQPFLAVLDVHDRLGQRLGHLRIDIDLGLALLGDLIGLNRALDELETDGDVAGGLRAAGESGAVAFGYSLHLAD